MITDAAIERYMEELLPARHAVLAEMEEYAKRHDVPIVGPGVARVLATLVMMSGAKRIFELGSAIGYSTIWLAQAAGTGAEVHYSDGDPAKAEQARGYFERAGVAKQITIHVGDALGALAATQGEFDLIFSDANKDGYPAVLDAVPTRIRKGGLLVTDNTLWYGKVLDPKDETDRAVRLFNKQIFHSPHFFAAQVPLRDGVTWAVRL